MYILITRGVEFLGNFLFRSYPVYFLVMQNELVVEMMYFLSYEKEIIMKGYLDRALCKLDVYFSKYRSFMQIHVDL